jgi:hypothetical protein
MSEEKEVEVIVDETTEEQRERLVAELVARENANAAEVEQEEE